MRAGSIALFLLLAVAAPCGSAACENNSPPAGDECHASGGVCSTVACGAALPYPCSGGEHCCLPPPSHGDGGGD